MVLTNINIGFPDGLVRRIMDAALVPTETWLIWNLRATETLAPNNKSVAFISVSKSGGASVPLHIGRSLSGHHWVATKDTSLRTEARFATAIPGHQA